MEGGAGFEPTAFPCAEDALPNVRPAHVRRSAKIAGRSGYEIEPRRQELNLPSDGERFHLSAPKEVVRNGFPDSGGMPRLCHAAQRH